MRRLARNGLINFIIPQSGIVNKYSFLAIKKGLKKRLKTHLMGRNGTKD